MNTIFTQNNSLVSLYFTYQFNEMLMFTEIVFSFIYLLVSFNEIIVSLNFTCKLVMFFVRVEKFAPRLPASSSSPLTDACKPRTAPDMLPPSIEVAEEREATASCVQLDKIRFILF